MAAGVQATAQNGLAASGSSGLAAYLLTAGAAPTNGTSRSSIGQQRRAAASSLRRGRSSRFALLLPALAVLVATASAQVPGEQVAFPSDISARKIFLMLFLMLGPIKILVPFVRMTKGAGRSLSHEASDSLRPCFRSAALTLAGLLGRTMMENFNVSIAGADAHWRRGPLSHRASDRAEPSRAGK